MWNPSHEAARQRGEPRSVPKAPALLLWKKHVAYRTESGASGRPPERNACRQRLQQSGVQELTHPRHRALFTIILLSEKVVCLVTAWGFHP
jgi:hypothetical protein